MYLCRTYCEFLSVGFRLPAASKLNTQPVRAFFRGFMNETLTLNFSPTDTSGLLWKDNVMALVVQKLIIFNYMCIMYYKEPSTKQLIAKFRSCPNMTEKKITQLGSEFWDTIDTGR